MLSKTETHQKQLFLSTIETFLFGSSPQRDEINDESKHHRAVDKSSSEQQIRIVDAERNLCEKNWSRTRSATGSYGRQVGRQAGRLAGWLAGCQTIFT